VGELASRRGWPRMGNTAQLSLFTKLDYGGFRGAAFLRDKRNAYIFVIVLYCEM
jgi:hypothetical protein